jgi:hypothetical protein
MKNKVSNTGKILSLIAFSIYAIMVGLTTFEISLEKESAFNLITMHNTDNNSANDNPTDNNQLTNIDIEDTTDYWISKIFFEFKVPKQLISNSLSFNYKESDQLQFQIDIVSPPPQV